MTSQSWVYGEEELAYGQDDCLTSQEKGTDRCMCLMILVQVRSMVRRTVSAHAEGLFFTVQRYDTRCASYR